MKLDWTIILAFASAASSIAATWVGLTRASKSELREYHVLVNSRLDQLIKSEKADSKAIGHAEGLAEGKAGVHK